VDRADHLSVDFDIIPAPGQWSDNTKPIHPSGARAWGWSEIAAYGYEWATIQCFNRGPVALDTDLEYVRAGGFLSVGVWGVVYDVPDFPSFGEQFAAEAVRLGADHCIVDAEMCAKGTRGNRGMKPIIDGMRRGGWAGPVHLSTLGAPSNAIPHGGNDFAIDVESYLETGGGVLPQVYYQAYEEYRPDLCADYWEACGVPRSRQNPTIDLLAETGSAKYPTDYTGAEWAELLAAAGVGRNFSVYMTQFGDDADYEQLEAQTLLPPSTDGPPPEPEPPEPQPEPPPEEHAMEKIGPDHGITAFVNWLQQQPGMKGRDPATYDPHNPYTWPWPEKLERTLNLIYQDYAHRSNEQTSFTPSATP
jgi:hypothetical protein